MSKTDAVLSTQAFAEQAGVSPSTVSKWLREGKIDGFKQGNKWQVPADQLARVAETPAGAAPATPKQDGPKTTAAADSGQTYSVEAFAERTYLTVAGVERWLKEGRLKGTKDQDGKWRVDGTNLARSELQHLIRR